MRRSFSRLTLSGWNRPQHSLCGVALPFGWGSVEGPSRVPAGLKGAPQFLPRASSHKLFLHLPIIAFAILTISASYVPAHTVTESTISGIDRANAVRTCRGRFIVPTPWKIWSLSQGATRPLSPVEFEMTWFQRVSWFRFERVQACQNPARLRTLDIHHAGIPSKLLRGKQ
jgi:hypothetical protein